LALWFFRFAEAGQFFFLMRNRIPPDMLGFEAGLLAKERFHKRRKIVPFVPQDTVATSLDIPACLLPCDGHA